MLSFNCVELRYVYAVNFIVFRPVHCGSLTIVPLLRYIPGFIFCVGDVKIINKGTLICVSNIGGKKSILLFVHNI